MEFVAVYDAAMSAVMDRIDMPDRKASLFVTLCLQNHGRLSARKRQNFKELSDDEVKALQEAIADAVSELQERQSVTRL